MSLSSLKIRKTSDFLKKIATFESMSTSASNIFFTSRVVLWSPGFDNMVIYNVVGTGAKYSWLPKIRGK